MKKARKKQWQKLVLVGLVLVVAIFYISEHFKQQKNKLPENIAQANGRIQAEQIYIASKYVGRIKELQAKEGDLVSQEQVLAILDAQELQSRLAQVQAEVARANQSQIEANSKVVISKNNLKLAQIELDRASKLVSKNALSRRELQKRKTDAANAEAAKHGAIAYLHSIEKMTDAAMAEVAMIKTQLKDFILRSPTTGRVLYRLAEAREVVAAGTPIFVVVDLSDIYMEVFLNTSDAALLALGAPARIKLDALPEYTIPANVVFVSPDAQFTPKQVEIKSERENLMFRVKLRIPQELVSQHIARVKTGVRGEAFIQLNDNTPWPESLEVRLPEPEKQPEQSDKN